MIDSLCGNKSIKTILFFLFVNGKCYGTQIHKLLKTSLTPIQKALDRLEKGGVISSYYEGKTRLYHFNPSYPLLNELEIFIKKAYALLPIDERKQYNFVKQKKESSTGNKIDTLTLFWNRLSSIQEISFKAKTQSLEEGRWNGSGKGEVVVTREGLSTLVFHEKGSWKSESGQEIGFSNTFRWTLNKSEGIISLEHLRRGWNHPVFLINLTPSSSQTLTSVDSHLCAEDLYFGQISFDRHCLHLNWRIIGPKKNETLDYFYS